MQLLKVYKWLMIALAALACNTSVVISKQQYLAQFQSFISNTRNSHSAYFPDDWDKADNEFTKLSQVDYRHYENDLTESEKAEIDTWTGQYYSFKTKDKAKAVREQAKHFYNKAAAMVEELVK